MTAGPGRTRLETAFQLARVNRRALATAPISRPRRDKLKPQAEA